MLNIIFHPEIFILKNSDGLPIYFYRTLDQNFILNLFKFFCRHYPKIKPKSEQLELSLNKNTQNRWNHEFLEIYYKEHG